MGSFLETYNDPNPTRNGNKRQSWILDSTLWIPNSRYWIPDFLSLELEFRIPIVSGILDSMFHR